MKTVYMCFATDVIHEGHMNVVKKAKEYGKVVEIGRASCRERV